MHEHLLDSLAKTSSYLNELRLVLEKAMMNDFFVAIDSYVSIIRDMTDEEIDNIPQVCSANNICFPNANVALSWFSLNY